MSWKKNIIPIVSSTSKSWLNCIFLVIIVVNNSLSIYCEDIDCAKSNCFYIGEVHDQIHEENFLKSCLLIKLEEFNCVPTPISAQHWNGWA